MEAEASAVAQLQKHLLGLIDTVRNEGVEDPVLRAEVLIQMNMLCSQDLLLGVWQLLEEVDLREEMLLVRLLVDMDPVRVEEQCDLLLQSEDEDVRAMGYGVLALHSTQTSTRKLVEAFHHEPQLVLKQGGRRKLAPYSFATCMLAGIQEFKDGELDRKAMTALRRFSEGRDDITLLLELLEATQPRVAKLGFVALASRVMGWIHRASYEQTICNQRPPMFDEKTRKWLSHAVVKAPEIVEVLSERGPTGLSGPLFARARVQALHEVGDQVLVELCAKLLEGDVRLPSSRIESALYPRFGGTPPKVQRRIKELAFTMGLLLEYRPALAELVEELGRNSGLGMAVVERMLMLSTSSGAFNLSTALLAHWYQLDPEDPDEGPFWRWIDGLWFDDRHLTLSQAIDAALNAPDETSIYAARVLASVDDACGQMLHNVCTGEAISDVEMAVMIDDARWISALRAHIRHPTVSMHPQTIIASARLGLKVLQPIFQARRNAFQEESPERGALDYALRLMEADLLASRHPAFEKLKGLGLRALDRSFERSSAAKTRLEAGLGRGHSFLKMLDNDTVSGVLSVKFWICEEGASLSQGQLKRPFDLSAELAIDLEKGRILQLIWVEGRGRVRSSLPTRRLTPSKLREGFLGIRWGQEKDTLAGVLKKLGGELIVIVPREGHRARSRVLARLHHQDVWLDFDHNGRLCCGVREVEAKDIEDAVQQLRKRYSDPSCGSAEHVRWFFEDVEVTLKAEASLQRLVEEVAWRGA